MAYPSDTGIVVIAVAFTFTFVSLCFVCARLYTRINIQKLLGPDDYMVVLAWTTLLIYSGFLTVAAKHGLGARENDPDILVFIKMYKILAIGQSISYIGIAASKASVALFLLRIVVNTWHKAILWLNIFALSVVCVLAFIFQFIRCHPAEASFNPLVPGKCLFGPVKFTRLVLAVSIVSVISDVALVIQPWTILYKLQMNKSEKRLIGCALSFGILAAIAGIIRTIAVYDVKTDNLSVLMYIVVKPLLWCVTELSVTICASCVPILRPLWRALRGQYTGQSYANTDTSRNRKNSGTGRSGDVELADKSRPNGHITGFPILAFDDGRLSDESILLHGSASSGMASKSHNNCGTSVESVPTDVESSRI